MCQEGQQGPGITAFREAEKKYQLHFDQKYKLRKGKRKGARLRRKETDFSEVVDFRSPDTWTKQVQPIDLGGLQAFCVAGKPGFCFILSALGAAEQCTLAADCLTRFTEPPAQTNHTKEHGPLPGLWAAAEQSCSWAESHWTASADRDSPSNNSQCPRGQWSTVKAGVSAQALLQRLRWASIGPNFDWTARRYLYEEAQQPLPEYLIQIAQHCAQIAELAGCSAPGCQLGKPVPNLCGLEHCNTRTRSCSQQPTQLSRNCKQSSSCCLSDFTPDAALVNFYCAGETLGGHCDDVEADLSKPIVSISLGCDAIFLLGGDTRAEKPCAMLVRSGDALVLAGESRRYYHGLPRILDDRPSELDASLAACQMDCITDCKALARYFLGRRINVSVRATM